MSSKNQLYLVVAAIEQCQWTYLGEQREGEIHPGRVVAVRSYHDGNQFEVHRGSGTWSTPVLVNRAGGLPRDKVAAITNQEFDLLLGVPYNEARLELLGARLKWACQLKVGDAVQLKLTEESELVSGVIRGSGTQKLSYGLQFIVETTVSPK